MATPSFNAVGFCAHYSTQGDWAFKYALLLSQKNSKRLNVFHFLSDPYLPDDLTLKNMSYYEKEKLAVSKEKELRMYYDTMAGEYLDVGFRVCYDKSWTELHRCLMIREFQILVLGIPDHNSYFANKPIHEFAESFISPVVLVGPDKPNEYHLNHQATLIIDRLCIEENEWSRLELQTV